MTDSADTSRPFPGKSEYQTDKPIKQPLWRKGVRLLLILFATLVTAVAVGGFLLPRTLTVSRTVKIAAPAPGVYDAVNTLTRWPDWAPWWDRDPFLEADWAGAPSGRGAVMSWKSRHEGAGRLKITGASPSQQVLLAMDFEDQGDAASAFTFTEAAGVTTVTWTWETDFGQNTGRRYYGLFLRKVLERDFDQGLATLKTLCENEAKPKPPTNPATAEQGVLPRKDSNLE